PMRWLKIQESYLLQAQGVATIQALPLSPPSSKCFSGNAACRHLSLCPPFSLILWRSVTSCTIFFS
ncbi:hypothetical protein CHARACLAT_000886, partial [Characodon lateralis]|nr:hypothetical protein [Characodon lateralis]